MQKFHEYNKKTINISLSLYMDSFIKTFRYYQGIDKSVMSDEQSLAESAEYYSVNAATDMYGATL